MKFTSLFIIIIIIIIVGVFVLVRTAIDMIVEAVMLTAVTVLPIV
jgi:hypothetical protein